MQDLNEKEEDNYQNKSSAYRFLFDCIGFSPRKASRSEVFNKSSKLSKWNIRKRSDSIAGKDLEEEKANPWKSHPKSSSYFGSFATMNSSKDFQFKEKSEFKKEKNETISNHRKPSFSDANYFEGMRIDDIDMEFEKESLNNINSPDMPCIILDNTPDDCIMLESEWAVQDSIAIDLQLDGQEYDESDVNLLHESDDFEQMHEIELQNRKETETYFAHNYVSSGNQVIHESTKNQKKKKGKNKSNSFSLGRTCFRGMSNYYKDKFEPILKQWEKDIDQKTTISMDELVTQFVRSEFEFDEEFYDSLQFWEFLDCMITVLHSQNHKKNESYIKKRDFKKIRNLLYWYSSNARKAFIENKWYAIIFTNFYIKGKEDLVASKSENKYPEFYKELSDEMDEISRLASLSIANQM